MERADEEKRRVAGPGLPEGLGKARHHLGQRAIPRQIVEVHLPGVTYVLASLLLTDRAGSGAFPGIERTVTRWMPSLVDK